MRFYGRDQASVFSDLFKPPGRVWFQAERSWCDSELLRSDRRTGVPETVPAVGEDRASGANRSQVARSEKWLKREDFRGKMTMVEMLSGV
jgi:hypothetical protein